MFNLACPGIDLPSFDLGFTTLGIGDILMLVFVGIPAAGLALFVVGVIAFFTLEARARRRRIAQWS